MLIFSGFLVGLMLGLTGVGGGALMTPLLLVFFGVSPTTAVGTDLWFAAITKIVAGKIHHSQGLIDWKVLHYLWAGSLPSSLLVLTLLKLGFISTNASILKPAIGIAILITAISLLLQKQLHAIGRFIRLQHSAQFKHWQPILTIFAGIVLGGLVTLTSIGAGALGVVILSYLYPLRLTPSRLVATDIVHAIPLTLFAGIGHLFIGHVDAGLLGWLLCGSIPGVAIGAKLSGKLPQRIIKTAISLALIGAAYKLIIS